MSKKNISTNNALVSISEAIVDVAENLSPSVVSIRSETGGNGSGVIWNANGYIITCYHVVKRLGEVEVALSDGTSISAKVVGTDPYSDIALLKMNTGSNLKPINVSDSQNLKAGQFVLAMANPYGDHPSITGGIITSLRNSVRGWWGRMMDDIVITDVRLNPGYSGGPLVNAEGKMVGICTAYISSRGIAIRSNRVKSIADRLTEGGTIKRAYMGVVLNTITIPKEVATQQLGTAQDGGLMILSVENDTPAKRAGLLIGDVIVKFDKEPVTSMHDLYRHLTQASIGNPVDLSILRGEKLTELTLTPSEAD
jgi:S1-C subfamily serine protease